MSLGKELPGQEFDPRTGFTTVYTQKMLDVAAATAQQGTARTELTPVDSKGVQSKTYTAITQTQLDAVKDSYPDRVNLSQFLPSTLLSVKGLYARSSGDGTAEDIGDALSNGNTIAVSLQLSAKANGSGASVPEAYYPISTPWAQNVPAMTYVFYMTGVANEAAIIAKISSLYTVTCLAWPQFKPKEVSLFLTGRQLSVSESANVQQALTSLNDGTQLNGTYGAGQSESFDAGTTLRIVRIEPTLHGEITIAGATNTLNVSADAYVHMPEQFPDGWQDLEVSASSGTKTVIASVTCSADSDTVIPATSPTDIPRTGLYLVPNFQVESILDGALAVRAMVVDMTYFA